MYTERRDYLMDIIEQFVARIAAILKRAAGQSVDLHELERDCERAMADEFAELHESVRRLDTRSAAMMIRPDTRLRAYAHLLTVQTLAGAQRREPTDPGSAVAARRALELVLEAIMPGEPTQTDLQLIGLLHPYVDIAALPERYLACLAGLPGADADSAN